MTNKQGGMAHANGIVPEVGRAQHYDQTRLGIPMLPTTSQAQVETSAASAACIPEEINNLSTMPELAESHMRNLMDQFGPVCSFLLGFEVSLKLLSLENCLLVLQIVFKRRSYSCDKWLDRKSLEELLWTYDCILMSSRALTRVRTVFAVAKLENHFLTSFFEALLEFYGCLSPV